MINWKQVEENCHANNHICRYEFIADASYQICDDCWENAVNSLKNASGYDETNKGEGK